MQLWPRGEYLHASVAKQAQQREWRDVGQRRERGCICSHTELSVCHQRHVDGDAEPMPSGLSDVIHPLHLHYTPVCSGWSHAPALHSRSSLLQPPDRHHFIPRPTI
jgi:hypothetical protein